MCPAHLPVFPPLLLHPGRCARFSLFSACDWSLLSYHLVFKHPYFLLSAAGNFSNAPLLKCSGNDNCICGWLCAYLLAYDYTHLKDCEY